MSNKSLSIDSGSSREKPHLASQLDDYKSLFMKSDTAVAILSVEGEFLECNEAFVHLTGYDRNTMLNGYHPGMISTEFQPDGKSSYKKAKKMIDLAVIKGKVNCEWLHKAKDGHEFLSHVTLEKVSFDNAPAICATVRDLSEQKKLERLVNKNAKNLKERQKQSRVSLEPIITTIFIVIIFIIAFYGLSIIEKDSRETAANALKTILNTMDEGVQLWADSRIEDALSLASNQKVIHLTEKLLALPLSNQVLIKQDGIQDELRHTVKDFIDAG
ncbi:MAG: PAS domain-containing protein, partial [Draconibacterium sp.]|nr:PAS domain-containing protein [Draconibacterium sp.]